MAAPPHEHYPLESADDGVSSRATVAYLPAEAPAEVDLRRRTAVTTRGTGSSGSSASS